MAGAPKARKEAASPNFISLVINRPVTLFGKVLIFQRVAIHGPHIVFILEEIKDYLFDLEQFQN
jgi:hypothetical protein